MWNALFALPVHLFCFMVPLKFNNISLPLYLLVYHSKCAVSQPSFPFLVTIYNVYIWYTRTFSSLSLLASTKRDEHDVEVFVLSLFTSLIHGSIYSISTCYYAQLILCSFIFLYNLNKQLIAKRVASTHAHVLLPTRRFDWFDTYYVIDRCDGHAAVVDIAVMDTLQ